MRRSRRWCNVVLMMAVVSLHAEATAAEPEDGAVTLMRVNGRSVTQADLDIAYLIRGIPPDRQKSLRKTLLERLIDERLIAMFLERRRIKPNKVLLDAQVDQIITLIRRRGEEPDELLAKLGLDQDMIRRQLSLPLAWETYVRKVVSTDQLRTYFEEHRRELDGTQVRARHIVVKVSPDGSAEAWTQATSKLADVRQRILQGIDSFKDASRKTSEGPSGRRGGDVGFFAHRGTMSAPFADAAFRLAPGELSRPVRTNAGLHLIEVTDERPGQFSLEDVRELVFERLSAKLWDEQVSRERAQANIVRSPPEDSPHAP